MRSGVGEVGEGLGERCWCGSDSSRSSRHVRRGKGIRYLEGQTTWFCYSGGVCLGFWEGVGLGYKVGWGIDGCVGLDLDCSLLVY